MGVDTKLESKEPKFQKLLAGEIFHTAVARDNFRHRARPKAGTSLQDLLNPLYWENARAAGRFRMADEYKHQGQVVEVLPEDCEYYAELLMITLPNGHLSVNKLLYHSLQENKVRLNREDFKIEFKGNKKNCIIRVKDGKVIQDQLQTPQDAEKALSEYLATA